MNIDSQDKYIWFVRHAQTIQNVNPNMVGVPNEDIPLSAAGVIQAQHFADISDLKADKIYMSPYKRAIRTAAPYIAKLIEDEHYPMLTVDKTLKEFNYYNTNIRDAVNSCSGKPDLCYKLIQHYWEELNPSASDGYATENYMQFVARVVTFLSSLININNTGTMVVFSHYYFITCIDNIFKASVDVDNLANDNVFDLPGVCDRIAQDTEVIKELMENNRFDSNSEIQNCKALYVHLRPYQPMSPVYKVLEYGYRDRVSMDDNGIVEADIVAE
jgi:broad specificity phosphatase PhoE